MLFADFINKFLRCDSHLICFEHDRSSVGIVGTYIGALMTALLLETNPDICLDVFHQMAKMDRAISVWESTGYKNLTFTVAHELSENLKV